MILLGHTSKFLIDFYASNKQEKYHLQTMTPRSSKIILISCTNDFCCPFCVLDFFRLCAVWRPSKFQVIVSPWCNFLKSIKFPFSKKKVSIVTFTKKHCHQDNISIFNNYHASQNFSSLQFPDYMFTHVTDWLPHLHCSSLDSWSPTPQKAFLKGGNTS